MVLKRERGKGIGAGLSRITRDWALQNGADTIMSEVWDDDERSLAFVRRFGFETERRSWQSVLDLASGEESASAADAAVIERLEDEGIRFVSLADLSPAEDALRQLHALETGTYVDIPGFTGDTMPYGDWLKWGLQVEGYAPERVIVALNDDQPIGICNVIRNDETGGMYHQYTCVAKEYRGRGIALALKLLAIRLALREGAGYLRTDNDSMNAGMLAVNRRLGYKALRGRYRVVAKL
ncbi:GNAT family N-acetyltransferase [Paenibacillus pasadenensis]|uniref:GNAT family N-acetyltransferase n=1 Tax=Paenibacillus pasadenensis TaxID=217090 RepID=UPI00204052DD|nr:GNAT family N-acetyltransferase [Paenibacillus pasadenensis]MCM3747790.1 GNAT family N-acetyltransferase [Paenibacillus pasadenensis]